jgi:hypothetical protein
VTFPGLHPPNAPKPISFTGYFPGKGLVCCRGFVE